MKKLKVLLSTILVGGLLLTVGFSNVYAEDGELKEVVENNGVLKNTSPSSIPLEINLDPSNVYVSGVTSHAVTPRINWYDGVSNSYHVSYTNAYGQKQLSRTFTSYSVTVNTTYYTIPSGETEFTGTHYASVSSNAGMASASGNIRLLRRR
ncbi:hypothetical protein QT711_07230 [Sporosarcina saromensis]|uniref:DUF5626 domain-containing protein n=1 Tax=Sporosarcina saromensis TaxID=359365 RepID=A0ABU4G9G1_9BACL|nr:hypothetical protein [Sporosarcina saromensis]MDW0112973.1 hypothetical protein [Sporosarcina saromensis]